MKKDNPLKSVFKTTLIFFAIFYCVNLYSQDVISRDPLDYPGGEVPEICATNPSNPGCIIVLPPALPGEDYSFQIPFINEAERLDFLFTFVGGGCAEGNVTFTTDGTIEMAGDNICQPFDPESNYIEILLLVDKGGATPVHDSQEYRIPIYRNPVKVVFVIDISESMELIVPNGIEVRWDVLKSSVNKFTSEFEKNYQVGDSISVIYYSSDTVMPGAPIDSNFIAITPEGFTPTNLKSSEIINADMQNQTLQGSAAMGNALLLAKGKLQDTNATKIVFLFTDGYQDEEPLVHKLDGNKLSNEELLNDFPYDSIKSIAYYTVGIGIDYLLPTVLKSISNASGAKNLSAPSITETFNIFFDSDFLNMLKGIREPIKTRIINLSPFDDSLNVPVNNSLKVSFNEPVNANSGFITIKRSSDDSEFESISVTTGNVSGSGSSVITINPENELESNTEYYILIDGTAFKNSDDETVTGISDKTYWNFTTQDILAPDVVISTLENNPTNSDSFEITIEFSEEINGFDLSDISVVNGTVSNLTTSNNTIFTADITPTLDGLITIVVNAGVVIDIAGNPNTESNSLEISFDSYEPSVSITTSESNTTNSDLIEITIEFSEEINGFDLSKINVTNGSVNNLITSDSIEFIAEITPVADGLITIIVNVGVVFDQAGNPNSQSNTFEINFDSTRPSVSISSSENNTTNSDPLEITIVFSEEINGFDVSEINVTNGSANNLITSDSIVFTMGITPATDGLITAIVKAGIVLDNAENPNTESNTLEISFDSSAPSLVLSTLENNPTNSSPFEITIEFSEEINGFDVSEISLTNGSTENLITSDSVVFTADITPIEDGLITIIVNSSVTIDNAGNQNTQSNTLEINFDSTRPSVLISSDNDSTTTDQFNTYVNFSERIIGFDATEINVTNGNINSLSTSDSINYVAAVMATAKGEVNINIIENQVKDSAGNMNTASDDLIVTFYIPTNIEVLKKDGISIYSNKGFVIIEFLNPNFLDLKSGYIEIYSLNGSLIKKEKINNSGTLRTFISNKPGIYLVKLTLGQNIYYSKVQN